MPPSSRSPAASGDRSPRATGPAALVPGPQEEPRPAPRPAAPAPQPPADDKTAAESRLRILLAEDQPVNQKVVLLMLESLGCTVEVAHNGSQAIAAAARGDFDLVLMIFPVLWELSGDLLYLLGFTIVAMSAASLRFTKRLE